ncbi:MAG: GspE/PulE family protein [Chloroherpetonaceae bacterium]|nr:GspE/PulE family protein [Chthonomonadaceae bacterium]MDW8206401.1 GspE/PulE family protein [Chloroherpetonaceae bacterium]
MLESLKPFYHRSSHLGEQLVADGHITQEQLEEALARQVQHRKRLGETLLQMGYISPAVLGRYLEAATRCQFLELADYPIDFEVAQQINEQRARRLRALPVRDRGEDVLVAMSDPLDLAAIDELQALLNRRVTPVLVFEADLNDAINRVFDVTRRAQGIIDEIGKESAPAWEIEENEDDLLASAQEGPVVRLVNSIIAGAIACDASDIHIEPQEDRVRVRYRIDGILADQMTIPVNYRAAVISRIKIMARCNIAERRRPQDGRILFKGSGRDNDLRVSIMPTVFGEKAAIRILERTKTLNNLEQMGFFPEQYRLFDHFIRRPHGMILVTGPTGSGKSTTLQAALARINSPEINISTIEDPVEYLVPGVNHTQVDPKIGVTFASGLRTLVRQDPDVIMVGEIRDRETAEIAIQAALTGHLVFSTLHTNDAPGAITRLINMGVEPFLIASALLCSVAQRLVRTVCSFCREEFPATASMLEALGVPHTEGFQPMLARGRGCPKCAQRGLKGRTAVFEIMPMTEEIRELTLRRESSAVIGEMARRQGMKTMREMGVRKVLQGVTTMEEVTRVLSAEE